MFFSKKKMMKKLAKEIVRLFDEIPHVMKQKNNTYFLTTHNILLTFDNENAQVSFSKNFITNQVVCNLTLVLHEIFKQYNIQLYVDYDFYQNESSEILFDSPESLEATSQFFQDLRDNIQNINEVEYSKIQ